MICVKEYQLGYEEEQTIEIPFGAKFLNFGIQSNGYMCVFAKVDSANTPTPYTFLLRREDESVTVSSTYIGTIPLNDGCRGDFIHLFLK